MYGPPNSSMDLFGVFERFLKTADSEGKETLLAGDINCNLATNSCDYNASTLKFLYDAYQHSQLISDFTRISKSSKTLIDHFITNEPQNISISGILPVSISDHNLIYGVRKFPNFRSNPEYISSRNMKGYDRDIFLYDLKNVPWDLLSISDDPNKTCF